MKKSFYSLLIIIGAFLSCDNKRISTIDYLPVTHDIYVNDTNYSISISWKNGGLGGSNSAPDKMEIIIPSSEEFPQTYTHETVNNLNLLYSGISIQISFGNDFVFTLPETQNSIDFWATLPHTKKEKAASKEEYYNTFYLSDILSLRDK